MDIRITPDGMPDLSTGDLAITSTAEDISQNLYRALLAMPANIIAGTTSIGYADLKTSVKAYLMQYFAGSKLVNPACIDVTITKAPESTTASVSLKYTDPTSSTSDAEIRSGMDYAVADGTVTSVAFERDVLSSFEAPTSYTVRIPQIIEDATTVITLPISPATDATTGTVCIFVRKETADAAITKTLIPFTIPTISRNKTYTVPNYATLPIPDGSAIYSVDVTDASVEYTLTASFGLFSISASDSGTISGTITVFNCPYIATVFEQYDTHLESIAFPLSPVRGKYRAIFPKPIPAGRYVIQYTGTIPG